MSIRCPTCHQENPDQARFCMHCSGPLTTICTHCGATLPVKARFCSRCGQPVSRPRPRGPAALTGRLRPSTLLSRRYRILRKLGQGGMGAVYLAEDMRLSGKRWAVKEMSDAALTDATERQQALRAFRREAEMLANLKHPNLPDVTDYFSENGNWYLVMEYVEGQTLEAKMAQAGGPLPEAQVVAWAGQICGVLTYLHGRRPPVIFRDLKPANVMIQPNGALKLIDFGIARHFKPGQRQDTQAFGTPGYAPPEQHGKGQTDARSDVYALGALLHHLLSGRDPGISPFDFEPLRALNPAVSRETEMIVARALELDPDRRWQTAADMGRALTTAPTKAAGALVVPSASSAQALGRMANPPVPTPAAGPPAGQTSMVYLPYASYGKRVAAYLIDSFIALLILGVFMALDESAGAGGGLTLLGSLLGLGYYIWPTARSGRTWGKARMGIQVVRGDGSPPGWGRSLARYLIGFPLETILSYVVIGLLGYLWPIWDKEKQAWHDKIAGTYVVDV